MRDVGNQFCHYLVLSVGSDPYRISLETSSWLEGSNARGKIKHGPMIFRRASPLTKLPGEHPEAPLTIQIDPTGSNRSRIRRPGAR